MPVLCMFYGIIVRMYREMGGKHNMPHIHAEYSGARSCCCIGRNCSRRKDPTQSDETLGCMDGDP